MKIVCVMALLILIPTANADFELYSGDTRSGTGHDIHKIFLQGLRVDAHSRTQSLFNALLSIVIATRVGASVKKPSEDPINQDANDQDPSDQNSLEIGVFDESRWNEAVYDEKTASSRYDAANLLQVLR